MSILKREKATRDAKRGGRQSVRNIAATTVDSARRLAKAAVAVYSYQPTGSEAEEYHKWYYNTFVWKKTSWMGITCWKSVSDMWNYQEILYDLKPSSGRRVRHESRRLSLVFRHDHEAARQAIQGAFRGHHPQTS